jgi:AraC-like DNA-binding protein
MSHPASERGKPATASAPPFGEASPGTRGSPASIRVGPFAFAPDLFRELGTDIAPVAAEAGLELEVFRNPDNLVAYASVDKFLAAGVRATGCEHLGFEIGCRAGAHSLGLILAAAATGPTVGEALDYLIAQFTRHDRGAVPTLTLQAGAATLAYTTLQGGIEAGEQIVDTAMAITCSIMRRLCGAGWAPSEVLLTRRRHADPGPLRRYFRAPLRYNVAMAGLVFPEADLHRQTAETASAIGEKIREALDLDGQSASFSDRVRYAVRRQLTMGDASADSIARSFSMHRRTLHRRLQAEGTEFRTIADEVRFAIAQNCLRDTDLRISEIALSLGYSEESAFIRAFRKWAGTPPGDWRHRQSLSRAPT